MHVLLGSQQGPRCRYRVLWQPGQSGLQDITPGRDTNPFQFLEFGLSRGVLIKQCFQSAPKTKPSPCLCAEAQLLRGRGSRGGFTLPEPSEGQKLKKNFIN